VNDDHSSDPEELRAVIEHLKREVDTANQLIEDLRENAEYYRGVIEQSVDYIVIHQDEKVVFANSACAQALGFRSPADLVGHSPLEFVPVGARPVVAERMERTLSTTEDLPPLVEEYLSLDGKSIIGEVVSRRVNWKGRPAGLVMFHDITSRLEIEEERARLITRINHAEKLESLGLLAAEVAHDFNNLLNSILGHTGLIAEDLPADSGSLEQLGKISAAIRQAQDLIHQLQTFAGAEKPEPRSVDLSGIIRDVVELLPACTGERVVVQLELVPGLPSIMADEAQMRRVVMNLVQNAIDAITAEAGKVCVRLSRIEISAEQIEPLSFEDDIDPGPYASLMVSDTGCGISSQAQPRVFDPFFSTKTPGRGLGLATVLGIVRTHHGTIRMQSTPGDGTTVEVLLPILEGSNAQA